MRKKAGPFQVLDLEPLVGLAIPGGRGRAGPPARRVSERQTIQIVSERLGCNVRGDPQVMVNATSKSYNSGHALAHAAYITRVQHGSLVAEDDTGVPLREWADVRDKLHSWRLSRDIIYLEPDPRRVVVDDYGKQARVIDPDKATSRPMSASTSRAPIGTPGTHRWANHQLVDDFGNEVKRKPARKLRQTIHLTFGMPAGTPPEKVLEATRALVRAEFEGHEYLMVLHEPSTDSKPNAPAHPHVHVQVRALSIDRRHRLTVNKGDLFHFRQQFAQELRNVGLRANSSSRLERLQPQPGDTLGQRKRKERERREFVNAAADGKYRLRQQRVFPDFSIPSGDQKAMLDLARRDYLTLINELEHQQRRELLTIAERIRDWVDQLPAFGLTRQKLDERAQALRESLEPNQQGKKPDLQGRIQAEQAMLTNEANKLNALYQTAQAEQLLQAQRRREAAIQGMGDIDALPTVRY